MPPIPQSNLAEWRSRTIACAELLDERSSWPEKEAENILEFLDFLLPRQLPSARLLDQDEPRRSMRELCRKAYDLSVLLRRSKKSNFKVDVPINGTVVTSSMLAQISPQASESPSGIVPGVSKITVTIFGGLIKSPKDSPEERIVLEQSHVVCGS